MLTTTQEYNRYWRETAQFFQPCDKLAGENLVPYQIFGAHIYEDIYEDINSLRHEIESAHQAELSTAEDKLNNIKEAFEELKRSLRVTADEETDIDVIKATINELCAV